MKCLAVNSAGKTLSIAVVEDSSNSLAVFEAPERRDQGNKLIGYINKTVEEAGISFDDLDLMAVVTGPGSFTGIRVGISAMRGFAIASKLPVVGVDAFEMFAKPTEGKINIVAIESWREELYFAFKGEDGADISEPVNVSPKELLDHLDKAKQYIVSGDAADKLKEILSDAEFVNCSNINSVDVAKIAIDKMSAGEEIVKPVPYYLRAADISVSTKIVKRTIGE